MYQILSGLRIIEASSFVAAPSAGMHLAQLGAQVIRIDQIGGGLDYRRWPKLDQASLYWEGLQKSKSSVALNLRDPEGRELAQRLITAPGEEAGLFVTNFPRDGFLSHEKLSALRADLITMRVQGWSDGRSGLDFTINAVTGYPYSTGPDTLDQPDQPPEAVNHVLPAWDLLTGALGAMNLLAAERYRRATGQGQEIAMPLSNVAFSALGALGQIAEVEVLNEERPRLGNQVFGAMGRDFLTRDGRRVMAVAISPKQWRGLIASLNIGEGIQAIEQEHGVDLSKDEGFRFTHRDAINPLIAQAISQLDFATVSEKFEAHEVCWGPYQSLRDTVLSHPEMQADSELIDQIQHPSGATYRTPGSPAQYSTSERQTVQPAPKLGENTEAVLADIIGLSSGEIGSLVERGIVAGSN
ncbi:MAG: CoA transferase [Burkholderiaceae bacterium]